MSGIFLAPLLGYIFTRSDTGPLNPAKFYGVWEGTVSVKAQSPGESIRTYSLPMQVVIVADTVSPKETPLRVFLYPKDTGNEVRFNMGLRARIESRRFVVQDSAIIKIAPFLSVMLSSPPEKRGEVAMVMGLAVAFMALEQSDESEQEKMQAPQTEEDKLEKFMGALAQKIGFKLKSITISGDLISERKMKYKRAIFFEAEGKKGFYEEEGELTLQKGKNPYDYLTK